MIMCDPITIAATATLVSTAFTARSQYQQGKYQRGVARYNARVAENEAQETRRIGVEEENIQRRRIAETLSKQRAQIGASGLELTSGSPAQLQQDTVTLGEADALRIRSNFEARAQSLETGVGLTRSQGAFAQSVGQQQAVGTILSGTSQALGTGIADKWFQPNSAAFQIQQQTGFAGGTEGVLSGEEFRTF